jgi:diamine N-acetyltransferase
MTTIELRPVTRENLRACIRMKVRRKQRSFVASNVTSMAEAYVLPEADPRLIYADDKPVGFVLFHPDEHGPGHYIVRFMIDRRFQGQGLGRRALQAAVGWLAREKGVDTIRLSVVPENDRAVSLYHSAGFVETGEIDDGEVVMQLTLSNSPPAGSGTG